MLTSFFEFSLQVVYYATGYHRRCSSEKKKSIHSIYLSETALLLAPPSLLLFGLCIDLSLNYVLEVMGRWALSNLVRGETSPEEWKRGL